MKNAKLSKKLNGAAIRKICGNCLRFEALTADSGKCRLKGKMVRSSDSCNKFADDVKLLNSKNGWYVIVGFDSIGPYSYLQEIDAVEASQRLGVSIKDVFRAKMRAYREPSNPIELDDSFELSSMTVRPVFNGLSRKIHPAIGVIDDIAYVSVTLPCIVQRENGTAERELPFLITSNRQKILCNHEVLSKLRLQLEYRVVSFENRWSLESIKAFIASAAKVDPVQIYLIVKEAWKTYIEFDNDIIYDFLTLWCIGTYFFHLFNAYPYVYIGGLKRSGKTKVLTVASLICFNAVFSNNLSTSAIFRLIQSGRCTLLMDETEKLAHKDRASELRNLLLSGYKRGAKVYRTEKTGRDRLVPEAFEVYCPKMIANIQGIEDILEDRCITIIMKRGKNKAIINSEPSSHDVIWQEIRDSLYILYLTYWKEIKEEYDKFSDVCAVNDVSDVSTDIPEQISDREKELWKPIISLASFFDKYSSLRTQTTQTSQTTLTRAIIHFALQKINEKRVENITETGELILVQTLLEMVQNDGYYKIKDIKDVMTQKFDEEQKWLNTRWIGRALKRLGFTEKRRLGTGREYFFKKQEILDLAQRLGIQEESGATLTQEANNNEAARTCWICGRPIIEVFEEYTFEPSTGKPCHIKCLRKVTDSQRKIQQDHGMLKCQFCGRYFGARKDLELHISKMHHQNKLTEESDQEPEKTAD